MFVVSLLCLCALLGWDTRVCKGERQVVGLKGSAGQCVSASMTKNLK